MKFIILISIATFFGYLIGRTVGKNSKKESTIDKDQDIIDVVIEEDDDKNQ